MEPSATVAPEHRDLSDTNSSTSRLVAFDYPSTLLRGNVTLNFKTIDLTLELENDIVFGPESCILDASILITHASSSYEQPCGGHFCGKLHACEYNGLLLGVDRTREMYAFTSSCSGKVCTELVFWFRKKSSLPDALKICKIHGYL